MTTPDYSALRARDDFQLLLAQLREQFIRHVHLTADADPGEAEKFRGVGSFISDLYEEIAGVTIFGDEIPQEDPVAVRAKVLEKTS